MLAIDIELIAVGVIVAIIYAIVGFLAQEEPFAPKKFGKTVILALFVALGMDIAITDFANVYVSAVAVPMITIFIQKLAGIAAKTME